MAGMTPAQAIEQLKAAGLTEAVIGAVVGTSQSTINRIKSGGMVPSWPIGQRIVDMAHAQMALDSKAA